MGANISEDELKLLAYLHENAGGYTDMFTFEPEDLTTALGIGIEQLKKDVSFLAGFGLAGMQTSDTTAYGSRGTTFILVGVWLTSIGESYMRELEERLNKQEEKPGAVKKVTLKVVQEGWGMVKAVAVSVLSEYAKHQMPGHS
jgi:hypothetical protein